MLGLEVNFLTGRFVATAHHDRKTHEWPPHPARLFSALVATWADADLPDPVERQALEWLEKQPPPGIRAPDAIPRKIVSHFVPVNDGTVISRSSYVRRYNKITGHLEEMSTIDKSDPKGQRRLRTLKNQIRRQRDVAGITSAVGTTSVESAVDLMPPGWLTHMEVKRKGNKEQKSLITRTGQAREYPSVTPVHPLVTYIWCNRPPPDLEAALDQLVSRVTRLGHSSSLVSCRLQTDPPSPTHVPGGGGTALRTVREGQLAALEREHAKHQASRPRSLPFVSVGYRQNDSTSLEETLRPDTAGELLVFEFAPKSRKMPATRTAELASALRGAVFHNADDPLPEGLSGHHAGGTPSTNPHVGFLGLPWVEHEHSDGRLMGMAISIPHSLDTDSRRILLRAVGMWENQTATSGGLGLALGRGGLLKLHRVVQISDLVTLRSRVWQRPSRRWVSVTPIALPKHPGPLGKGTATARAKAWKRAEQAIIDACRHIGLPEPVDMALSLDPLITGVRPAQHFPAFRQGQMRGAPVARRLVHASVAFNQPVEGPLVLGAGRYLGLGLMRPARKEAKQ